MTRAVMLPVAYVSAEPTPVAEVAHTDTARTEDVHVSHYWPPLGGTNCSRFVNGECISRMAGGERWQDHIDSAAACPPDWVFGTMFVTPDGRRWVCMDRGGRIVYGPDGLVWVDLLTEAPGYRYGEVVTIEFED